MRQEDREVFDDLRMTQTWHLHVELQHQQDTCKLQYIDQQGCEVRNTHI